MKLSYIATSTQMRVVVYMNCFEIICLNLIMEFTCSLFSLIMKSMVSYVILLSSHLLII